MFFSLSHRNTIREDSHNIILGQYWPPAPWVNWKSKPEKTQAWARLSRRFKRIMEKSEGENNIVCTGWMAQEKHGRNNTIESSLLIKGGNLAEFVPARRAPSANPDMSTSDLHHSSPQARINGALTPRKSLSLRTTAIWPRRPGRSVSR